MQMNMFNTLLRYLDKWCLGAALLACLGLLIGIHASVVQAKDANAPLVIGISGSSKPFAYENDKGELTGFNYDLANLLCERLRRPCEVRVLPFADVLAAIDSGDVDIAIANLLRTPERDKVMLFSQPIWRSTTSFIGAADLERIPATEVKKRYKICAIERSRQWAFVDALDGPKENVIVVPRIAELFDGLAGGQCQLAVMPTISALQLLSSARGQQMDYFGAPLTDPLLSGTVHIAVSKEAPELVPTIDAIMDAVQKDGTYRGLIFRYFPFDIL
jgi:ABC-type amino acid transport substrate-binding protein